MDNTPTLRPKSICNIIKCSNSRMASKYYGNNKEKFYNKLQQFDLTAPTHIDLKGEQPLI